MATAIGHGCCFFQPLAPCYRTKGRGRWVFLHWIEVMRLNRRNATAQGDYSFFFVLFYFAKRQSKEKNDS
jgi:hypothetical protein